MDRFINEYREIVGQKVAYNQGKEGILAMGRYLKEKHLLGILYDQDTNDTGVKTVLFGKEVITPAGPAVFSRTFGCPILPIFMHYDEDGSCRAKIYPPLYAENLSPAVRRKDKGQGQGPRPGDRKNDGGPGAGNQGKPAYVVLGA